MQNGDRYIGVVVSMTPDTVVLQSEVLGQIKVPRTKVSTIALGATQQGGGALASTTNSTPVRRPAAAQRPEDSSLLELGANKDLIEKIKKQFLSEAGPQANEKFDDMLTGLMTGKLDMNNLRAQAKSAADQLRAMKKDLGGDAGDTLQAYLDVLDSFLADSTPPTAPAPTNSSQGTIIIR
jgi:hypothetical protein